MEPKTHHVTVGIFMVGLITLLTIFFLWISRVDFQKNSALYDIYFDGSVTGLRLYEDVRYHGVPIGDVRYIGIDKQNPDRVKVRVSIKTPHLIRTDAVASLEAQGLTGFTYVQIQGGTPNSPALTVKKDEKYPTIQSQPSRIEVLFSNAPQVVSTIYELSERMKDVFDDQNRTDIRKTIHNLEKITSNLASGPGSLDALTTKLSKTLTQLGDDVTLTTRGIQGATNSIQTLVQDNQGAIQDFTQQGLPDLGDSIQKLKKVLDQMTQLLGQLNDAPLDFFRQSDKTGITIP